MEVLGWLFLLVVLLFCSFAFLMTAWNTLGTYNIGGKPNSPSTKLSVAVFGLLIFVLWWILISCCPFSIVRHV